MQKTDFRHLDRLRVRWAEVDMQHIVFNGHYLTYVDTAVGGYWRALGLPYQETMAALGGDLFVRKATLEYHGPALYDDVLDIGVRLLRIGNSSIQLQAGVFRGAQLLVSAELVYVFAEPTAKQAMTVPESLREVLRAFERGEAMLRVRLGSWAELQEETLNIRRAVLGQELGLPAAWLEPDATDAQAVHAVVFNRLGRALGAGRGVEQGAEASIGRVAVCRSLRGAGVGTALLEALQAAARARGHTSLQVEAAEAAEDFYRRAGFEAVGASYAAQGLQHRRMELRLA